ncbi:hypothetical protein NUU61_005436 [Penicillium alfredii]|uniref:Alpha-taxilin n=1 Tax=Penicillium alfredii TaxID=1506179 RepID=A0A9W9F9E2_9EURO|nr:uncharacterized protein NUU61_005436 [Penicillium alfredii]KAJ5096080.1 hypothetical protein NUU61_005436 [Penicillium alfredii]
MSSTAMSKKNKGKKVADPNETSKLLAAKISQLEQDAAGEKDQEVEIEREVKKATRDLNQLLNNIESPMTRLETVHKKYTELLADMKKLDRDYAKSKKRADQLQKDQDKSKSELTKTVTMKDKLEKLCRELTKENKKVKDDNKKLDDTEQKARVIVNERLDSLLFDIEDVMAANGNPRSEKGDVDLDDSYGDLDIGLIECLANCDTRLRTKLKTISEQFDTRELHYKGLLRSKDSELQSLTLKFEEQRRTAENETARGRALSTQVSTFSHTEAELRSQLNIYVEKFKQVEDTLNNSNELFLTFRKEMEEMSKKTKRLEKENHTLNRKHEQTNRNILEMAEERTRNHEELERWRRKCHHLEALCRRMQAQGRGEGLAESDHLEGDDEGTESEYDEDYEDEEEEDISDEELDGTDQDVPGRVHPPERPVFGPPPPPSLLHAHSNGKTVVNGKTAVNGCH